MKIEYTPQGCTGWLITTMTSTFHSTARWCVLVAAMLAAMPLLAQDGDMEGLRLKRWRMIDKYHVSVGVGAEYHVNTVVTPRVSLGMGSFRNLLNADAGVDYEMVNPIAVKGKESLGLHRVSPFGSVTLNAIRWRTGGFYVGGEMVYAINLRTRHRRPDGLSLNDPDIAKHHLIASAKSGVRFGYWDVCLYYCHDISPAFGQKYIYESDEYDFIALEESIYERYRFGIRLTYHITLRP